MHYIMLFLTAILSGCQTPAIQNMVNSIPHYKVEIIQGNTISAEQVSRLQVGMNKQQVKEILGTTLLRSSHPNRWDYVFTIKDRPGVAEQSRVITVYFVNELLDHLAADEILSEAEIAAAVAVPAKSNRIPALKATRAQLARWSSQQEWP